MLVLLLLQTFSLPAHGQDRRDRRTRNPFEQFADPSRFFEQFFGREASVDPAELAKVKISVREEAQIGQQAVKSFLANLKRNRQRIISRGNDLEYVQQLVATIKPMMTNHARYKSLKVYLIDSPSTDARVFPGGTVFFTKGLLSFAESEAALIGVVGHELSHLDRGHQLDRVKRIKLMQQNFSRGASPEKMIQSGLMMMQLFMRPFRPEDELQADLDSTSWIMEAGYDPREFAALFQRLAERDGDGSRGLPAFLRTHPYHRERVEAVQERFEAAGLDRKLYIGRRNLRERVPKSVREFDEE